MGTVVGMNMRTIKDIDNNVDMIRVETMSCTPSSPTYKFSFSIWTIFFIYMHKKYALVKHETILTTPSVLI
jgi:hypothetical protein